MSWRIAGVAGIALLVLSGVFASAVDAAQGTPDGGPLPVPATVSLGGANRYSVAVSISGQMSRAGGINVVYLVSGTAYADAVAAGPAAARDHAVILYTDKSSLPTATFDELARLNPSRVEVVGDSAVISDAVFGRVADMLGHGSIAERVSGTTASDLASTLSSRGFQPGIDTVVVSSEASFYDCLVAGPAAAALGAPLLLVTGGTVPAVTEAEIRRLGPRHVVVVGGSDVVSDGVLARIGAMGPAVERISGGDRFATAAAVRDKFFATATAVVATTALDEVGGLAAVPLAASEGAAILLTQGGDQLPNATRDSLIAHKSRRIFMAGIGGPQADVIGGEIVGFSHGLITVPTETATYPSWDSGYHDPGELLTILKATEIAYPTLVRVFSIGKSFEGRDIWAAKVSSNVPIDEDKPEVLVDALHHAAEHLGVEQALYLLRTLTADYAGDPYVHRLVDERTIWIIFAVNPDGWVYDLSGNPYGFWRKNRQPNANNPAVGTDLNRNYAYEWAAYSGGSSLPWSNLYWGPFPFSAPETRAVADFVASRVKDGKQRIRTHVTLHTHGELILYPFAYTYDHYPDDMNRDDYAVFLAMAAQMSSMNHYGYEQSSLLFPSDGDEIDWMYGRHRIFSFTFEMYPTADQAGRGIVYVPDEAIAKQTARNRVALLYLIDAAACPYAAIGKAGQYCGAP